MDRVFQYVQADTEDEDGVAKFYTEKFPGEKISIISKKYTYYIAGQIGGRFDWLGQDVNECHQRISSSNADYPEKQIKPENFKKMCKHFERAFTEE